MGVGGGVGISGPIIESCNVNNYQMKLLRCICNAINHLSYLVALY